MYIHYNFIFILYSCKIDYFKSANIYLNQTISNMDNQTHNIKTELDISLASPNIDVMNSSHYSSDSFQVESSQHVDSVLNDISITSNDTNVNTCEYLPSPSVLIRTINEEKWNYGLTTFKNVENKYLHFKTINEYLIIGYLLYIVSMNIIFVEYLSHYFTLTETLLFYIITPHVVYHFTSNIINEKFFVNDSFTRKIYHDKMILYPTYDFEYGMIISIIHQVDKWDYWIAKKDGLYYRVTIKNNDYTNAIISSM